MGFDSDSGKPAAIVTFGHAGNSRAFQLEGWAAPEAGFTWTLGQHSRLNVPYRGGRGVLTLEMRVAPMSAAPQLMAQRLTLVVNGREYGTETLTTDSVLAFALAGIRPGDGGRADIELRHPDAAAPADYYDSHDKRCLGLCLRELKLQWVPAPAQFTPRHRPALAFPAPGQESDTVRGYTGLRAAELMHRFESLGHNCEFGIVQKILEAHPLGLLRFAGIAPPDLLRGLRRAFAGIEDAAQIGLLADDNNGVQQYLIRCESYRMQFHSFMPVANMPAEDMRASMVRHLGFLRRLFEEKLREGRTIFVLHDRGCTSVAQARPFLHALRAWGPTALLFVTADDCQTGSVDQIEADLFHGHIDYLMPQDHPETINVPAWLSLCANAYRMWREAGGGGQDE